MNDGPAETQPSGSSVIKRIPPKPEQRNPKALPRLKERQAKVFVGSGEHHSPEKKKKSYNYLPVIDRKGKRVIWFKKKLGRHGHENKPFNLSLPDTEDITVGYTFVVPIRNAHFSTMRVTGLYKDDNEQPYYEVESTGTATKSYDTDLPIVGSEFFKKYPRKPKEAGV